MNHSNSTMRLGKVIILGFSSVFTVMICIGFISKVSMDRLSEAVEWETHTYEVKTKLKSLEKDLVDAETGQRGFIFAGKEEFLEPYNQGTANLSKDLDSLKELLNDNPAQLKNLDNVEKLAHQKLQELAETIRMKKAGKDNELKALVLSGKGKKFMDEIRSKIEEMTKAEEVLLVERKKTAEQAEQFSTLASIGGTVAAVGLGAFIVLFISRRVIKPINQVANTIVSSSTEIAATVEQQQRNATHQASAVNQTTTTMDELNASSRQSAQQAEAAAYAAQQVLVMVDSSLDTGIQNSFRGSSLRQKVRQIGEQILRLNEQVSQINNIATLVGDLSNQTNMLALNAAVEAVRAGEHGKGFAVVAAEIRKLADQSRKSVERINTLVTDIQKTANSTVIVTDEGKQTVESIVNSINNIAMNNQQISLTAKQQAIAIEQVVEAMNRLNYAAQETAAGINQTQTSIKALNEAALNLNVVV